MSSVISNIKVSAKAIAVFTKEIAEWGSIETGGVLMGFIEGDTIYIDQASGPGPDALHDIVNFQADPHYIDMVIDMEYANSKGRIRYIGEWHTHPQVIPEPSETDLESLSEIALTADPFALLFIIGSIGYTVEKFREQSVCVIKSKANKRFFKLHVLFY